MKEIKITSNGIKQAIDDLVNENELLQDKVYKQNEEIERLNNNWNKLKNELENILFFDNDTIRYEDLMNIINRIEESDK